VQEAVAQGPGHRKVNAALRGWVAGSKYLPIGRHDIVSQPAVKHQLVARGLDHLRRGGQLVEKKDAFTVTRQEVWYEPLGGVTVDAGKAAQVNGVQQNGAQVDEFTALCGGQVADDFGLADAGGTPNMHGDVFAEGAVKRLDEGGRSHGLLVSRLRG
jgi:hypothetical protein